jgi:diacylglycerol kinase family enzyme
VKRVLLISNARAGSVSNRTKEVIAKALSADFKLDIADTESRGHASDLSRDAVDQGFDAVLAFGGDGTVNEAAQELVETDVALGVLPGGSTNVLARSLGIPSDPVDATAFAASHLRSGTKRRINVGRIGARYFLFSCGMGLDAEVVKRVEADPDGKRKHADLTFLKHALSAGFSRYRGAEPNITMEAGSAPPEKVLFAIACNARPFTYFGRFPLDACPEASLEKGLDFLGMTTIHASTIPRIVWAVFVSRSHVRWKNSRYITDVSEGSLRATEPMPVQVDGDYVGDVDRAMIRLIPNSLDLLV